MSGTESAAWFCEKLTAIETQIARVIVGQREVIESVLFGMASGGHVLLEGMPGLGKTLTVRTLSEAIGLSYSRIQFTPDLMPSDVTGTHILRDGRFEMRKGPIFGNLILADEINRATPKTQSAMLEAMQERAVTIGGQRMALDEPFLVMATQNPIEQEGTYPLPEAQLDRFFMKVLVPSPSREDLLQIANRTTGTAEEKVEQVATAEDILRMRTITREVLAAPAIVDHAASIVLASHPDAAEASDDAKKYVRYGASPRGVQGIITAGKVAALKAGRFNVSVEDLEAVAYRTLRHRMILNFEAQADGVTPDAIVAGCLARARALNPDPIRA